ncbi:MAG TPA: DUF4856 domain-containing protein [Marinagarivorans sp.]
MKNTILGCAVLAASLGLVGCGSSSSDNNSPSVSSSSQAGSNSSSAGNSSSAAAQNTYAFTNAEGVSTVAYTGQVVRQVMIEDIKAYISKITRSGDPTVKADLMSLFENPSSANDTANIQMSIEGYTLAQTTYGDISTGKSLVGKIAGGYVQDGSPAGEKPETLINGTFFGWQEGLSAGAKPYDLVVYYFDQLQALAAKADTSSVETVAGAATIDKVYVDENGVDYLQLAQKFLLMAVGFSQGVSDYLGPNRDFANELTIDGDKPYTTAEHHFDEGFGYFGATPNYAELSDSEIIAAAVDTDMNGIIDLTSEYNFGQSVNCAKRDVGATNDPDLTGEAISGFIEGRTILAAASAAGSLTAEQETALNAAIAKAAGAWEKCIAATVVHYINDVIADMAEFSNGQFASIDNFYNLAKHWGEMKGFALGLQFNPYSPFREPGTGNLAMISYGADQSADLEDVLTWMGDAPVLADASEMAIQDYEDALLKARDVLQVAYGFDSENVADW